MRDDMGVNNASLKRQNRGLLFKLIATGAQPSRIELAKESGLTKMSVTNIIADMMAQGLVEETGIEETNRAGRNPVGLAIAAGAPKLAGLLIERDGISVVLCDFNMHVLLHERVNFTGGSAAALQNHMFVLLDGLFAQPHKIVGIGVGALGPLDIKTGTMLNPPHFYDITDFPLASLLMERYRVPVWIDDQCNLAALVECHYGAGRAFRDFLYVGIGNGVGSGIVTGGKLLRNAANLPSEIGHVSIDYAGIPCPCGNKGCLEMYISFPVLRQRVEEITGEKITFRDICERDGTVPYGGILDDVMEKLSYGLVSSINLLNPQAVMLGHECCWLPEHRIQQLQTMVNLKKITQAHRHIKVIKPQFMAKTTLLGCACGIADKVFSGALLFED